MNGDDGGNGGSSDSGSSEEDVYSPEEDRANMSIVRFGTVDSRRISTDYYSSYFTAPPGASLGKLLQRLWYSARRLSGYCTTKTSARNCGVMFSEFVHVHGLVTECFTQLQSEISESTGLFELIF